MKTKTGFRKIDGIIVYSEYFLDEMSGKTCIAIILATPKKAQGIMTISKEILAEKSVQEVNRWELMKLWSHRTRMPRNDAKYFTTESFFKNVLTGKGYSLVSNGKKQRWIFPTKLEYDPTMGGKILPDQFF